MVSEMDNVHTLRNNSWFSRVYVFTFKNTPSLNACLNVCRVDRRWKMEWMMARRWIIRKATHMFIANTFCPSPRQFLWMWLWSAAIRISAVQSLWSDRGEVSTNKILFVTMTDTFHSFYVSIVAHGKYLASRGYGEEKLHRDDIDWCIEMYELNIIFDGSRIHICMKCNEIAKVKWRW